MKRIYHSLAASAGGLFSSEISDLAGEPTYGHSDSFSGGKIAARNWEHEVNMRRGESLLTSLRDSTIVGEVVGEADPHVVHSQVARILSLDIDGRDWPRVGKRDLVMGRLQARYPGWRPVCFFSPYEAAAWALISQRIHITQAARIKARLAEELGPVVEIHKRKEHAFPGPSRLMQLETFPGLCGHTVAYLHQLAQATLEGKLEAPFLRGLAPEQALEHLKTLPGIGDFSAQLILLRGAGEPDALPTHDPRLGRAITLAYGLDHLSTTQEIRQIAEDWRPYRTWGSLLLRVMLEEETQEIASGRESP